MNSLSWKVLVLQLLKLITSIVFELQSWYWYQKKRKNVLYNVTERFFQFSNYQKNYDVWKFEISMKNPFFRKKWNNSKTNTKFEKNTLLRCRTENSASIDMNIDSVGQTVITITKDPHFSRFLWITRFLWRKWKKVQNINPIYFLILHMSTKFHYDRTNNKEFFFFGSTVPLRQKRNITLDRVAFEERKQQEGELFDDFYVAIRSLADESDLCEHCKEQRITTRIIWH